MSVKKQNDDNSAGTLDADRCRRMLAATQKLSHTGGWEYNVLDGSGFWSEELYRIHEIDNREDIDLVAESLNCYLPEDREIIRTAFRKCVDDGVPYEIECAFNTYKNNPRWIRTSGRPIFEDGRVVRVLGIIQDLTDLKQIDSRLENKQRELEETIRLARINEQRFESYAENTILATFVVDTNGDCIYINGRWTECTGMTPDAAAGRGWLNAIHPDDRSRFISDWRSSFRAREEFFYECRFIGADGVPFWIEGAANPLVDEQGEFSGYIGVNVDISRRMMSMDRQQRTNRLLEEINEITKTGGWEYDISEDSMYWTNGLYQIHKLPKDPQADHINLSIQCYEPGDGKMIMDAFHKCMTEGIPYDYILPFHSYAGDDLWIRTRTKPVYEDGRVVRIIGSVVDVTESKQAEIEISNTRDHLESALQDKNLLIRELYHRTKNNMQIIGSFLSLKRMYSGNEEAVIHLREAESKIHTMALVHQLLFQSKDLSNIDINDYLHELMEMMMRSSLSSEYSVSWNMDISHFPVLIDTALPVGLIVNELVTNSAKYAFPEKQGSVFLSMQKSGDTVVLRYTDSGPGLPNGFSIRQDSSLGLKIINQIVTEQLAGSIELGSGPGFNCRIEFSDNQYSERV